MTAAMPHEWELPVSEARERFAEVVEKAEAGIVVHLTRYGRRVAAVVPEAATAAADPKVHALTRRFIERNRALLDRLAES